MACEPYRKYVVEGVCLSDIAEATGLSTATTSRIFAGKQEPKFLAVLSICRYLAFATKKPFTIEDLARLLGTKPNGQAA